MSGRYIIGGIAIAGASYYLYQQRLEQAKVPSSGFSLPTFGSRTTPQEGTGQYTGRKLDEAALKAKDQIGDLSDSTGKKIDDTLSSVEKQRSKITGWASDKLQDASEALDAHSDHANQKAELFSKQAHRDDPGRLKKFGSEVKESIYDAKDSVSNNLHSAKDAIAGSAQDVKNKAKTNWFNLGEAKEEELARQAKLSLEGWGETAAANANEYYEAVTDDTPRSKSSWLGWRSKAKENEDSIKSAYDDASKSYEDAKKKFNETKSSWFALGDEEKKRLHAEAEKQLALAQQQYDATSERLNNWLSKAQKDTKGVINTHVGDSKEFNGFYDWLRGGVPYSNEKVSRVSKNAVRGWGDTEDATSLEQHSNAKYSNKQIKGQVEDSSEDWNKATTEWNRWFNKKYDETAQGATDYYNDAQKALNDAQRELESQHRHWWSWGEKKSKDLELEAKRNVEEAETRLADATNGLTKWGIDVTDSVLRGAEQAVKSTKAGLDKVNDKTQQGLGQAQSWIKDQQK